MAGRRCDSGYTMCVPVKGWHSHGQDHWHYHDAHASAAGTVSTASTEHGQHWQRRAPAAPRFFPCPKGRAWNGRSGRAGACMPKRLLGCR